MWEVEVTNEFADRWNGLTVDQQESVTDRVDLLADEARISAGRSLIASRDLVTTT